MFDIIDRVFVKTNCTKPSITMELCNFFTFSDIEHTQCVNDIGSNSYIWVHFCARQAVSLDQIDDQTENSRTRSTV
jgi:hypothetical protein